MKHLIFLLLLLISAPALAAEIVIDANDIAPNGYVIFHAEECGATNIRFNSEFSDEPNIFIADTIDPVKTKACIRHRMGKMLESVEVNHSVFLPPTGQAFVPDLKPTEVSGNPNDPLFQFQWNLTQVQAPQAWDRTTGKGVVVAVIDTGVAFKTGSEPRNGLKTKLGRDLIDTKFTKPYDFVDDHKYPWDCHGHGTHVAGTIAQSTNNKYGVAGLAHGVTIMPIRVLGCEGYGSHTDIAEAIRYAADNGANVINMSLGGSVPSMIMKSAVKYAYDKGVTIVAAAGNSGTRTPSFPAAYDHVIAVAATQYDKTTTYYSQYGDFVDIAAPGGNTQVDQNGDGRPDGILQETVTERDLTKHDFALYMGTSMASPHVAAAAALLYATGTTNPDAVERALKRSAYKADYMDPERYGAGILQTADALKKDSHKNTGTRLAFTGGLFALFLLFRKPRITLTALLALLLGGTLIPEWDLAIFGLHQTPLFASAAIPVGAALLLGNRPIVWGLAIGFGGFLFAEAALLTSDVLWIPGQAGTLDQAWLLTQGAIATSLAWFTRLGES